MNVVINDVQYVPIKKLPEVGVPFAVMIKERRAYLGMTMREACDKIGCSAGYICELEKGTSEPSLIMGYKIARAYNLDLEHLAVAAMLQAEGAV